MKIGVILPNWVGDLVMATPMLRAVAKRFPQAEVVGILRPYLIPLLEGGTAVSRFIAWEHHGRGRLGRSFDLVRQMRRERFDLILSLRNSPSGPLIARLGGAKEIVGYRRRGSGLLLTKALSPPRNGRTFIPISAVDYYLAIAYAIGCPPDSPRLELSTSAADEAAACGLWRRLSLPDPSEVILLNAGGAYGSAKHWPREHCVELARRLAEQGRSVLVMCGPAEREVALSIARAAQHPRVMSLANEPLDFGITKAIIRRSQLMVTTDSGPRHIAAALGTPTVALFGPIDPRWSENYDPASIQLRLPLECSPCGKRVCPLAHHRCMRDLSPDFVLQAINKLSRIPSRQIA